ncbi:MAG TPA: penicillin acylase family protein [Candidatus Ozemobacteraceae bacterium]|nr:penicillin acylase family protein [Candidatus Ozemobacteraceae bacterium]HQG28059.1 penicillin acylase family protein [Candidatus Ozemobacteraceae bacterium]
MMQYINNMKRTIAAACMLFAFAHPAFTNEPPGLAEYRHPMPGVEIQIWRDPAGVPHVVASTTEGVYWGFGYCIGQDRMMQLELLRRSCRGTLSELFGKAFLDADTLARRDRVPEAELQEGFGRAPNAFRTAVEAFTRGLNRAVEQMRQRRIPADPGLAAAGVEATPFSVVDVLEIFAGTMGARYNDFTQELDNLHLLSAMVRKYGAREASRIFEDVVFYRDPAVYTTLGDVPFPFQQHLRHSPQMPSYLPGTEPYDAPTLRSRKRNQTLKMIGIPDKSGSYAAVLSRLPEGKREAFLYGGPQMGYFSPSAVYEIGLHTPEFDLVGTTPAGYLALLFGANRDLGFSATAGVGNIVDVVTFRRLASDPAILVGGKNPAVPESGEIAMPVVTRTEKIPVKGLRRPVERTFEDTPLGPVIAAEGPVVYVKHRAWKGRLIDSYAAWFASNHAKTLENWLDASDGMAISINWLGADRGGHIAYVHTGCGKSRRDFGDDRLPTAQPTVFPYPDVRLAGTDPASGFYANWNCPPVNEYRDGDLQTGWGADQRTKFLAEQLAGNRERWSVEYLRELDRAVAFTDLRAWFFRELLTSLIDEPSLTAGGIAALGALRDWNGLRTDENGDGLLDHPGAGLFDAFWNRLFGTVFGNALGEYAWMLSSDPTWTQTSLLAKALKGTSRFDYLGGKPASQVVTEVFSATVAGLASEGARLPLLPCPAMEFAGVNHVGAPTMAPTASCTPYMNRGSDVQIMHLSPDGISIIGVMPPGNAGWGTHATDQMPAFKAFEWRERPLSIDHVRSLATRLQTIKP